MPRAMLIARQEWRALVQCAQGLVPLGLILAAAGGTFVWMLHAYEGWQEGLESLWAIAVEPWLPLLAAALSMRGFTEDRATGMLRLMFSTPVRDVDWVLGKWAAAWAVCLVYVAAALLLIPLTRGFVPAGAMLPCAGWGVFFACVAMMLQSAMWCATGVFVSLFFRRPAATGITVLALCGVLPPALYALMRMFFPAIGSDWTWLPLQSHVYDFSTGMISLAQCTGYLSLCALMIYSATVLLGVRRMLGCES